MATIHSRELLLRWLLALGCFAVLVFCFSPSWSAFQAWSRAPEMAALIEVRRGASVLEQIAHPGAEMADPVHRAIQWRLLFPLIGRALALPSPVFFSLAHLGCLAVLGYAIASLRRRGATWSETALATMVLGSASWFFTSTGWLGYFDSWLALGLLIVAFSGPRWSLWAACIWAPWVDERFIVALPLALVCRTITLVLPRDSRAESSLASAAAIPASSRDLVFNWKLDLALPVVLAAVFAAVRLGLLASHSGPGATLAGYFADQEFLNAPLSRILLGVWEGLRGGWLFVAAAVVLLWQNRAGHAADADESSPRTSLLPARKSARASERPFAAAVAAATVLTGAIGLATAQDYSRSMTMLLPVVMLGLLLAAGRPAPWPRLLRVAALIALVLPAHHVMNNHVSPIYYLYHELAALRSPPANAMPELFELRAIQDMERGEFARAHLGLTIAIKLAENPASPARQRGILAASHGRWAEALQDFSTMVQHDSGNPEARLMRAQAHLALGQAREARTDLDEAIKLAPEGWSRRADVAEFVEELNRTP